MKKKYILMAIFYILICLFFFITKTYCRENVYTISGEYTYSEVLNALSEKTKRSVLGSTEALTLKRMFDIYEKNFHVAVDHVNKNLFTDGYVLYYDSSCFYIKPLSVSDTGKKEKEKTDYQVYLPYSKRYIVTKDREKYLNSIQIDKENYINDSINYNNSLRNYKIDVEVLGFTDEKLLSRGFNADDNIGIQISKDLLNTIINMNLGISYTNYKINNTYNFYRNLNTYINKDTCTLLFGSEERRINSQLTNEKIITSVYESVYNGITIKINKDMFTLLFRDGTEQINISGMIDSVSYCQYKVKQNKNNIKYRFVRSYQQKDNVFYMFVRVKKTMIDK